MKKLKALLTILSIGFIAGCGGGDSSDSVDLITQKDLITIFYHSPIGMCEDVEFQNYLKESIAAEGIVVTNYIFREVTDNVTCATYDRAVGITEAGGCMTYDLAEQDPALSIFDTNCVIGMDLDPNAQPADITTTINSAIQGW